MILRVYIMICISFMIMLLYDYDVVLEEAKSYNFLRSHFQKCFQEYFQTGFILVFLKFCLIKAYLYKTIITPLHFHVAIMEE